MLVDIKKNALTVLLLLPLAINSNLFGCSRSLADYDYLDICEISKLCDVAYSDKSHYLRDLEQAGWSVERLFFNDEIKSTPVSYGIKASNGPLIVYSFSGTKLTFSAEKVVKSLPEQVPCLVKTTPLTCAASALVAGLDDTILADCKATLKTGNESFPNLPSEYIHEGILEHYKRLNTFDALPQKLEFDELMVLSGHSLGGAITYLTALEILQRQSNSTYLLPDGSCSLITFGAPPIMGSKLVSVLDEAFPETSNLRVALDNDPVANWTRGDVYLPMIPCDATEKKCIFQHPGFEMRISSSGIFSHSMELYSDCLEMKRDPFKTIWPQMAEGEMEGAVKTVLTNSAELSTYRLFLQNARSTELSASYKDACLSMIGLGILQFSETLNDFRKIARYPLWRFLNTNTSSYQDYNNVFGDFERSYCIDQDEYNSRILEVLRFCLNNSDFSPSEILDLSRGLVHSKMSSVQEFFIQFVEGLLEKFQHSRIAWEACEKRIHKSEMTEENYAKVQLLIQQSALQSRDSTYEERIWAFRSISHIEVSLNPDFIKKMPSADEYEADAYKMLATKPNRKETDQKRYSLIYPDPTTERAVYATQALLKFYNQEPLNCMEKSIIRFIDPNLGHEIDKFIQEHKNGQHKLAFQNFINVIEFYPESQKALVYLVNFAKENPDFVQTVEKEEKNKYANYREDPLLKYLSH